MKALNKVTPEWYTPKAAEEQENPARFMVRGLTGIEFVEVMPFVAFDDEGGYMITVEAVKPLIKHGLVDWENIEGEDGKALPFGMQTKLAHIQADMLFELAKEIYNRTQVTGDEQKKL